MGPPFGGIPDEAQTDPPVTVAGPACRTWPTSSSAPQSQIARTPRVWRALGLLDYLHIGDRVTVRGRHRRDG